MARNLGLLSSLPIMMGPSVVSSEPILVTFTVLVWALDQNKLLIMTLYQRFRLHSDSVVPCQRIDDEIKRLKLVHDIEHLGVSGVRGSADDLPGRLFPPARVQPVDQALSLIHI